MPVRTFSLVRRRSDGTELCARSGTRESTSKSTARIRDGMADVSNTRIEPLCHTKGSSGNLGISLRGRRRSRHARARRFIMATPDRRGTRGEDTFFWVVCIATDRAPYADYADERRIVADKRLTAVTGHAYLRQSAVHLRNLRSGCWTDRHHDACLPQERPLHTHSLEGINNKIDEDPYKRQRSVEHRRSVVVLCAQHDNRLGGVSPLGS